jgi:hypothetical protein
MKNIDAEGANTGMTATTTTRDTATLLTQLRALLDLTNTEIQIAETRILQARTEAVKTELTQNAEHARERALSIANAIRDLGGAPDIIGPIVGRAAAAVKALAEQAEPFQEALLGDLTLEDKLLDRARYLKALAVTAKAPEIEELATQLITAHSATVEWLTTVLAEDALGGPAALRRTPLQALTGAAVKLATLPGVVTTRVFDRAVDLVRNARPTLASITDRSARAGEIAAKAVGGARDAALSAAESITRDQGADGAADALHSVRSATGILDPSELPIADYDELNQNDVIAAIKELDDPADIRAVVAYEEAHKERQRVVSAAQARVAAIAQEVVGIS